MRKRIKLRLKLSSRLMIALILVCLITLSSCATAAPVASLDIPTLDAIRPDYDIPDLLSAPTTKSDYLHNMVLYKKSMELWQDYSDKQNTYITKLQNIINKKDDSKSEKNSNIDSLVDLINLFRPPKVPGAPKFKLVHVSLIQA